MSGGVHPADRIVGAVELDRVRIYRFGDTVTEMHWEAGDGCHYSARVVEVNDDAVLAVVRDRHDPAAVWHLDPPPRTSWLRLLADGAAVPPLWTRYASDDPAPFH
jgi:hypothetical protein